METSPSAREPEVVELAATGNHPVTALALQRIIYGGEVATGCNSLPVGSTFSALPISAPVTPVDR
jgi:hypothetical protein